MKLANIERYTVVGNWESQFPLVGFLRKIEELIDEDKLDLCPDFQRGHVWTEEQQISFMEHILRGGKSGTTIYVNHPNWGDSFLPDTNNPCVLVDGLQRYTAIKRYVNNEIKAFGKYVNEWEDADVVLKRSLRINMRLNINNLKTRKEVLKWYLEMNSGGTPHSNEELVRVAHLYDAEK